MLSRKGNCYELSAKFVVDNPEWTLVHGIVTGQEQLDGVQYGHAWVERGPLVYDLVVNDKFSKLVYYSIGKIKYTKVYTLIDVYEIVDKLGHYGPWDLKISKTQHK